MPNEDLYETTSFHDNHVHGLSIQEGEHGTGTLVLDIDHAVDWLPEIEGHNRCLMAPAFLTFQETSDLVIAIDYAAASAGIVPFSISWIRREPMVYPTGYRTWNWTVYLNWPQGELRFKSPGFTLELRAEPIRSDGRRLSPAERQALLAIKQ